VPCQPWAALATDPNKPFTSLLLVPLRCPCNICLGNHQSKKS
jgi:hypothetical protein